MVELPSLLGSPFDWFSATFSFEDEDLAETMGEEFSADSRWGEAVELHANRGESSAESTIAHLRSDYEGDGLIVELSLERRTVFRIAAGEVVGVEEVSQALSELTGIVCRASVEASFQMTRSDLPTQGLINSMLGVKTAVAGEQLLLTGANFTMRGFPDESVSWFLSHSGALRGTVTRMAIVELSEKFLTDSLDRAQSWFHRLILERGTEPVHAVGP